MTTLRQYLEEVAELGTQLFERNGHLRPAYAITTPHTSRGIVPAPPTDDKDFAAALMRKLLEDMGATRVVFMDECWIVRVGAKDEVPTGSLEHVPGRQEALLFSGEDETEGFLLARREIIRDGDKATLGPLEIDTPPMLEGRMVGLLPKRRLAS